LQSSDSSELQRFLKILPQSIHAKKYNVIKNDYGISGVIEAVAVKALAPHGLYSATVSPEVLMKYADGTVGSIVTKGGKIIKHSGFISAETAVFAPMIVMQVLSIITSQYYLNGINKQLETILCELNKLKRLNYSEDEGMLFSIQETLKQKMTNHQPDESDFSILDTCRLNCVKIAGKYLSMLNGQSAPEKTKWHIDEYKRINEIIDKLHATDGEYYMGMTSVAYDLSLLSDTAYVYVLTYIDSNNRYNLRITDYIINMNAAWKSYQNNYETEAIRFYDDFYALINKYKIKWSSSYEDDSGLNQIISEFKEVCNKKIYQLETSPCIKLKDELINYLQKPKETLICIDNKGRQTVLQEQ
jgi:hypothetical protein